MGLNSTPFLSYPDIRTDNIDPFEDAFGLRQQYGDVMRLLDMVKPVTGSQLTRRLKEKIKKDDLPG